MPAKIRDPWPVVREVHGELRGLLGGLRGANSAVRWALAEAGKLWIAVFLPKRFDMEYAKRYLGYSSTQAYNRFKAQAAMTGAPVSFMGDYAGATSYHAGPGEGSTVSAPQPTPFVFTGLSRAMALSSAYPVAAVTADKAVLTIKIQLGAIAYRNAETFTKVPFHEYARITTHALKLLEKDVAPAARAGALPDHVSSFTNPRNAIQYQERIIAQSERRVG